MPLQPGTTLGPYAVTGRKGVVHIAQVADLVARARSPVVRHGYSRDIEDTPEPEMPARLARQLAALVRGVALVRGHRTVAKTDLRLVARVGVDCLQPARRTVFRALTGNQQPLHRIALPARQR